MRIKERSTFNHKQAVCLLLSLVMIFTVAGCTKTKENDSKPNSSTSSLESSSSENVSSDDLSSENSYSSDVNSIADIFDSVSSTVSQYEEYTSGNTSSSSDNPKKTVIWVNPAPDKQRKQIVVSKVVNDKDKYYIEHNGKPYLQYGIQAVHSRTSDVTEAGFEELFVKTKELNFRTILLQVKWKDIEPEEGKYNLYEIQRIIKYADKYGLNVELLWFGDNVCGSNGCAPDYVANDRKRFPFKGSVFDYSSKELLDRESKALIQIMNYLYDNDTNRRVAAIQLLNEANMSDVLTAQHDAFLSFMNKLGLTVKNSAYSIVTRVNLVINESYLNTEQHTWPEDILALEGIDAVGPDVYTEWITDYGAYAKRFSTGGMATNPAHIAEGPGHMYVYPKQVLYSFACNAGYDVYELRLDGNQDTDCGIYRASATEWIARDGTRKTQYRWTPGEYIAESKTDDIAVLNKMIGGVAEQIASCHMNHFTMIFRSQTNLLVDQNITFAANEKRTANRIGAIFLAKDGYYYFFTPAEEGYFRFENKTVTGTASIGSFENGEWKESGTVAATEGNVISVSKGYVYRISSAQLTAK